MKKLLSIVAFSCLAACTSTPVDLANAPHVSSEELLDTRFIKPISGRVPVRISFDHFNDIFALQYTVFVDGSAIARIKEGEQLALYLPAGRRVISAGRGTDGSKLRISFVDVLEPAGGPYVYRITRGADDRPTFSVQ